MEFVVYHWNIFSASSSVIAVHSIEIFIMESKKNQHCHHDTQTYMLALTLLLYNIDPFDSDHHHHYDEADADGVSENLIF